MLSKLISIARRFVPVAGIEPSASRRSFVFGLCALGTAATAGSILAAGGDAHAAPSSGALPEPANPAGEFDVAQRYELRMEGDRDGDGSRRGEGRRGDGRRHDDWRHERRHERRHDRHDRRDGHRRGDGLPGEGRGRMSRRELRRRCANDRSFRRRNPDLCRRVEARGRAGTCIEIGPLLVCD